MTDPLPLPPLPKKDDPDFAEKKREYDRARRARPEVKEREKESGRAYRARPENKERIKEQARVRNARPEIKERNKERQLTYLARPEIKERKRAYRAPPETKERMKKNGRSSSLKNKYGLTLQDVDAMIAAQNGRCFLCGKLPKGKAGRVCLYVDHCHKTGKIRAMLCSKCNQGLGLANDSPTILHKMIDYIESYQ